MHLPDFKCNFVILSIKSGMKRIYSLVSIIMLVALTSIQLVQAAHHHDEAHHFAKHSRSSSQEDFQLVSPKCFVCILHSHQSSSGAILPSVVKIFHHTAPLLTLHVELDCKVHSSHLCRSYNKGPPMHVPLVSL
ncbi:hypothetical protein B0I27_11196 [Arcticibacter pallidicorallinus]|uniref:Uncharacterized protein n=1 Tax=Arcticibacter pallidicorallinus TaxID=1259464 RepID=A0A2T0TV66_9SPHI|nr:hypothetical protein B0I27_11196 [Arcticibacter pallidicorallinus]